MLSGSPPPPAFAKMRRAVAAALLVLGAVVAIPLGRYGVAVNPTGRRALVVVKDDAAKDSLSVFLGDCQGAYGGRG